MGGFIKKLRFKKYLNYNTDINKKVHFLTISNENIF